MLHMFAAESKKGRKFKYHVVLISVMHWL